MSRHVLTSFLGRSDYVPVRYRLDEVVSLDAEAFVQAALLQCLRDLGDPVHHVVILTTRAAAEQNWAALQDRLAEFGVAVERQQIPDGSNEKELWQIFNELGRVAADGDRVSLDLTHGFRSLPVTGILSMAFYRHVRKLDVAGVYYGAFETLGSPKDVRERQQHSGRLETAPIFDLTPMFDIPRWAEALGEWRRTGRADGLASRATPVTNRLGRQLKRDAPRELVQLPTRLSLLGDLVTLLKHDQIGGAAQQVIGRIPGATTQASDQPALAPLVALAQALAADVAPLTTDDGSDGQRLTEAYLQQQLALVRWLQERRRLVEGFSVLRELITSCAARVALRVGGIDALPGRTDRGETRLAHPRSALYRQQIDVWTQSLCGVHGEDRPPVGGDQQSLRRMAAALRCVPELSGLFRDAYQLVRETRNGLDHCWTGQEPARQFNRSTLDNLLEQLGRAASTVERLLTCVGSCPEIVHQPLGGCFLNLSNHPLASWSDAQLAAARALGLGEPTELPQPMPPVDPQADSQEVRSLARKLAQAAGDLGAAGAFVAGDYSLTLALVGELQAQGVRCFAATTERDVSSKKLADGSSAQTSRFHFVRWREYL